MKAELKSQQKNAQRQVYRWCQRTVWGTALDNNGNDIVAAIDFDWTEMGNNYGQWFADNCPGENIFVITGKL